MSVVKHFIEDSIKKKEIDEFLQNEFERAGYGGVSITKTPLGTHLVIYTMRPGLVIGRGGETIRALATVLEENFQLPSPQISVAEIEVPELNAYVVASRIASALKRGVHYRRAGFWGLNQAMEAGALGIEIIISGKLRTDRARYEKFRTGYLPKSGEPPRKYLRKAELHVQLKPGTLGVKVRLIPPDAQFPDKVQLYNIEEDLEGKSEKETVKKQTVTEEETTESEVSPTTKTPEESDASSSKEETASSEKPVQPKTPVQDELAIEEKVSAKKKSATEEKVKKKKAPASEKKTVKTEKKPKEKKTKKSADKTPVTEKNEETKKSVAEPENVPAKKMSEKKVVKAKVSSTENKKEEGD